MLMKDVRVNTKRTSSPTAPSSTNQRRSQPAFEKDFEQLSHQDPIVEHYSIPSFLRRIPHKWHIDEITRFGDKVGRAAESLQLAYLTTVDRSLGVVRVFPAPLLQRIYQILSPQFGWPQIIELEPPQLDEPRRSQQETLRSHERLLKHVRALLDVTQNVDVQHSIAVVVEWLEHDSTRIRQELGVAEPSPAASANPPA
jgi:hypothetical protein